MRSLWELAEAEIALATNGYEEDLCRAQMGMHREPLIIEAKTEEELDSVPGYK